MSAIFEPVRFVDTNHVAGIVRGVPSLWEPEDPGLLWVPPGIAIKSLGDAKVGEIDSVEDWDGAAWARAQIAKHAQYVEMLRSMVKQGRLQLTAGLQAFLDGWRWKRSALRDSGPSTWHYQPEPAPDLAELEAIRAEVLGPMNGHAYMRAG